MKNRFLTGVTIHDGSSCYHDGVILPDKVVAITFSVLYKLVSLCFCRILNCVLSQTKKTQAEIQREYRKRKKEKEGDTYLEKERKRTRHYYTPAAELNTKEKKKRRAEVRERVKKCREKAKAANRNNPEDCNQPLVVDFNFKGNNAKKRVNRGISKAKAKVAKLEDENVNLRRTDKRLQKRLNRAGITLKTPLPQNSSCSTSIMSASTEADDSLLDIPDAKRLTDKQISSTGIRPHQVPTPLRKRLLLGNVLIKELRVAVDSNEKDIKVVKNVAAGKICKKYRCVRALGKSINISRQRIAKTTVKSMDIKRKRRSDGVSDVVKSAVLSFFKRDDNFRAMPGKNDAKKVATGMKKQK